MEHKNNDRLLYNIFFIYDASFFDFLKALALPMKKYFKSTKLTLIFYSLFVAFDNFYQIISLKFFYFRSLLEEYFFEDFQIQNFVSLLYRL
jgi:hypothetical protein